MNTEIHDSEANPQDAAARPSGAGRRILTLASGLFTLIMMGGALWIIHSEIAAHPLHEILREFRTVNTDQLILAVGATIASYCALALYDFVALGYTGRTVALHRTAFASFTAYALSNSLGFGFLTGTAVRYRLYAAWGLDTASIAVVAAATGMAMTLGAVVIAGFGLLFEADEIRGVLPLSAPAATMAGAGLLAGVLGFVVWSAVGQAQLRIGRLRVARPPLRTTAAQAALSVFDWAAAALVLFALLPGEASLSYGAFLPVFVIAAMAGAISGLPGGVGVFEAVILLLVPGAPADAVAAALLLYRVLYFLLPLGVAAGLLALRQVFRSRDVVGRVAAVGGAVFTTVAPLLFSLLTFIAGLLILASAATPSLPRRLSALNEFLPLGIIEASHFVASLAGVMLLVVAWGLRRRFDGAHALACVLLGVAAVAALLKGGDFEEAVILAALCLALLTARGAFYRHGGVAALRLSPAWLLAVGGGVGAVAWLGFFAFRHVEYDNDLWWTFVLNADVPRFLRAQAAIAILATIYFVWRFAVTPRVSPALSGGRADGRVAEIISHADYAHADANLAFLGDKFFLFSPSGRSFIMYGARGRNLIAMGEPVGLRAELRDILWQFRDFADRQGANAIFYSVRKELLPDLIDIGLTAQKIGETALVPLETFALEGASRAKLRSAQRKLVKEGCRFEIVPRDRVPDLLPVLKSVSDEWLAHHQGAEKGFTLGRFAPDYIARFDIAAVWRGDRLLAFANLWATADKSELSVDLMRHAADAPNGTMDGLFVELALWGRAQGYKLLDLGMAPLAGLEAKRLAPFLTKLGSFIFEHGEALYGFEGLRQYKDKFDPLWEPLYLAAPSQFLLPIALGDIALLTSGGFVSMIRR